MFTELYACFLILVCYTLGEFTRKTIKRMRDKRFYKMNSKSRVMDLATELDEIRSMIEELRSRLENLLQPFLKEVGPLITDLKYLSLTVDEVKNGFELIKKF